MNVRGESVKEYIRQNKPMITAFVIYTAIFVLLARLAVYVLPFAMAMIVAVVMKPLYDYLRRRFGFRSAFCATALTLLIFGALLAAAGFLLYLVARQGVSLFERYGYLIRDYFASQELFNDLKGAIFSGDLLGAVSDAAASLLRIVPLAVTFVIITFVLTIFFLHHLADIRDAALKRVREPYRERAAKVFSTAYLLSRRFIRSYLVLYLITFVEAVFIFYLTGVEYPLAFAFITAVADILPVLGPGTVYLPFAVLFIIRGNYLSGATLAVYFLITVVLRQIIEPKLVSDTVKVHPLAVMAAIYFSIAAMNIWVLFYVVIMLLLFKVLRQAGILPS